MCVMIAQYKFINHSLPFKTLVSAHKVAEFLNRILFVS